MIERLVQYITIDLNVFTVKAIRLKQYNKNSQRLIITVTENNLPYFIDKNLVTCAFKMITPDDRAIYNECTINDDGTITVDITESCCVKHGKGEAELDIIRLDDNYQLCTMNFDIIIEGSVYENDKIIASPEFDLLTTTIAENKKLNEHITGAENTRKQNETARVDSENDRKQSEDERIHAENTRKQSENDRIDAENIRNTAENTRIQNEISRETAETARVDAENAREIHINNKIIHITDEERTKWNDKYSKSEIDNKFSAFETNIDWKESVETFDDIITSYPDPQDGWTVNTKDTDYTYRYNGAEWVCISANAIPKSTQTADGLMSAEDKKKLDGIAPGAKVNAQSDWSVTDTNSDAFIKNKPTSLPASNTTSDYSSTGTSPVNGTAVNKALQTLDVAVKGGSGKYIQSISETDGKIIAEEATMPTIPSIGNGTVTIKQAGMSKGTFTMNQSGNTTIELTDNNTTYGVATQSANGLMTAADKKKLDDIDGNSVGELTPNMLDKIYPVGSIYMSVVATDPSDLFGGTWEAWGAGRVPVGVNVDDNDFNTAGKTGGTKAHTYTPSGSVGNTTLTANQIPSHNHSVGAHSHGLNSHTHTFTTGNQSVNHTHSGTTGNQSANHTHSIPALFGTAASAGKHEHTITSYYTKRGTSGSSLNSPDGGSITSYTTKWADANEAGAHTHSVTTNASTSGGISANHTHAFTTGNNSANHTHSGTTAAASGSTANSVAFNTGATGGDGAHNHGFTGSSANISAVQPYITCYMWKRTA